MADSSSVPKINLIGKISNVGHYIPISKLGVLNPIPHLPAVASSMKNGVSAGCTAVTSAASYTYNALPPVKGIVHSCGKLGVLNPIPHLPAVASSMKNGVSAGCTAVTSATSYTYNALPPVTGIVHSCGKVVIDNAVPYLATTGSMVAYNALSHTYKALPEIPGMTQSWSVLSTLYSASPLSVIALLTKGLRTSVFMVDSIARGDVESWKVEAGYNRIRNEYTFKAYARLRV